MIFLTEEKVEDCQILGYAVEELGNLSEGLPEPFKMNFWWDGSARKISEAEQDRLIVLISADEFDDYLYPLSSII